MLWQAGERFRDRYRLVHKLGAAGNRQTWIIEEETNLQKYVLKALYCASEEQFWQDQKLFEREAITLKSIAISNVPKFFESFWLEMKEGSYFCLIMEYIPGESLADLITNTGSLPLSRVKAIAAEVLETLEVLHSYAPPVIHRDIKPANLILRTTDQQICLVDFGSVQTDAAAGRTFTVVGTYGYMAPEQFSGAATPASDLYSLGASLLYLLSGLDPSDWPRKGFQIILNDQMIHDRSFRLWLTQLLEPNAEKRIQSALLAQQSLQKVGDTLGLSQKQKKARFKTPDMKLEISPNRLQVDVASNASGNKYYTILNPIFIVIAALIILFPFYILSHMDSYKAPIPVPFSILLLLGVVFYIVQPVLSSIRSEKLIFEKGKREYIVSWGFLFRKSYPLNKSFEIAVDPSYSDSVRFVTLISEGGRQFPLGHFNEEDAELLVKELQKWREDSAP
ncbi:MAG: serine/threonine protein kinase [Anaerolineae bacterium]|nr:serine/threonine protein kinase [Gloeobacterales cyanobacterium ES-bin-313]